MTRSLWKISTLLLLALAPTTGAVVAQQEEEGSPVVIGRRFVVTSETLGEERPIQVHTPPGYADSDAAYPVLYLLDGRTHFVHAVGSVGHLARNGRVPAMIVVAVGNTPGHRMRDLTPATSGDAPEGTGRSGGAEAFLEFLTGELRSWVEARYRTSSYDILAGHSFGGLFVTHVLDTDPGLFDAYVSISPSLWWDDGAFTTRMEALFDRHPDARGSLYMTMANEGGEMIAGAWRFLGTLETRAPESFQWRWQPMPDDDHGSVPARSLYDGLEWIFEDYAATDLWEALFFEGPSRLPELIAHYEAVHERFAIDSRPPEHRLVQVAYGLLVEEDPGDAVLVFDRTAELYPDSASVHNGFGDALVATCRLAEARVHYEEAIRLAEEAGPGLLPAFRASLEALDELEAAGEGDCF